MSLGRRQKISNYFYLAHSYDTSVIVPIVEMCACVLPCPRMCLADSVCGIVSVEREGRTAAPLENFLEQ